MIARSGGRGVPMSEASGIEASMRVEGEPSVSSEVQGDRSIDVRDGLSVDESTQRSDSESANAQGGLPIGDESVPAPDLTDPDVCRPRSKRSLRGRVARSRRPPSLPSSSARPPSRGSFNSNSATIRRTGRGVEVRWIAGWRADLHPARTERCGRGVLLDGQRTRLSRRRSRRWP